jgi:DNA gyrase subunit A
VLTATENGFGKRTLISEYTRHGRGTKGMLSIQTSERNGKAIGAILVNDDDEIILLTSGGKLVRTRVSEIRVMGRNTQGVNLITMDPDVRLVGMQRVTDSDEDPAPAQEEAEKTAEDPKEAEVTAEVEASED